MSNGEADICAIGSWDWEALSWSGRKRGWEPIDMLDSEAFVKCWKLTAEFPSVLRRSAMNNPQQMSTKLVSAIERAVSLLGTSKYSTLHHLNDVLLNGVIATETILCPYKMPNEEIAENFRTVGSGLIEKYLGQDRDEWAAKARRLYLYRCDGAHQAMLFGSAKVTDVSISDALSYFYLCLKSLRKWVQECFSKQLPIDRKTFDALCREVKGGN